LTIAILPNRELGFGQAFNHSALSSHHIFYVRQCQRLDSLTPNTLQNYVYSVDEKISESPISPNDF